MSAAASKMAKREADGLIKAARKNILVYGLTWISWGGGELTLTSLLVLVVLAFKDFGKFIFEATVFLLLMSSFTGTCVK